MSDWLSVPVERKPIGVLGWLRVGVKGIALALLVYICLILQLLLRLIEWPIFGAARPWTPKITRFVSRNALRILGLGYEVKGKPMTEKGAVVANHSSWLDIFTLNAGQEIYFVSKAEVAKWPGIGFVAKAVGTVFIARKGTEAKRQQEVFEARLRDGHKLLFFPEGTSTDAIRVLPFKSTLFQAFFMSGLDRILHIQPVTVIYHAPEGEDPRFYGWFGPMSFGAHLMAMLAAPRHGKVEIIYHPPVPVDAFQSRKELSQHCERVILTTHSKAV